MKHTANARFAIKSWEEKPYNESPDLPKLTRATVSKTYTGDIAGEAHVEYLMNPPSAAVPHDSTRRRARRMPLGTGEAYADRRSNHCICAALVPIEARAARRMSRSNTEKSATRTKSSASCATRVRTGCEVKSSTASTRQCRSPRPVSADCRSSSDRRTKEARSSRRSAARFSNSNQASQ